MSAKLIKSQDDGLGATLTTGELALVESDNRVDADVDQVSLIADKLFESFQISQYFKINKCMVMKNN